MNLDSLQIVASPLSGVIYAGYSRDGGKSFYKKVDVTQQVVNAVSMHMHLTGKVYECISGELVFNPTLPRSVSEEGTV